MLLCVNSNDIGREDDESLNQIKQDIDSERITSPSYAKAVALENQGEYEKALNMHKKVLEIRRKGTDRTAIGDSLDRIGILYMLANNFSDATQYFCEALKCRSLENDLEGFCTVHTNLSKMYYLQSLYTNESRYLNNAIWELDITLAHLSESSSPALYKSCEIRYEILQAQMLRCSAETTPECYQNVLSELMTFYDAIKENPQFGMQNYLIAAENNIAVILALMGDRDKAYDLITKCLAAKEAFYGITPGSKNIPCSITRNNLKAIKEGKLQDLVFEY